MSVANSPTQPSLEVNQPSRPPSVPSLLGWALIPCLLAIALSLPSLKADFIFDDAQIVRDNDRIDSVNQIPALFTDNYWGDYARWKLYRPVTLSSFAIDQAIWGTAARGYHFTNVILYGLNCGILFLLFFSLTRQRVAALIGALLFATHPIHTEAVGGLVGRSEILATMFASLALLLQTLPRANHGGIAALTGFSFALGIFSKETAIAFLPLLALLPLLRGPENSLIDRLFNGFHNHRRAWICTLSALLIWGILRSIATGGEHDPIRFIDNPLHESSGAERVIGALSILPRYFKLLIWPHPLFPDYSYPELQPATSLLQLMPWLGLVLVVASALIAIMTARSRPEITFGFAFLWISLLPPSNLIFASGTIFGERLLYMPSAGLCLLMAALLSMPSVTRSPIIVRAVALVIILGFCSLFSGRIQDWRDDLTLFQSAVDDGTTSAKVYQNLSAVQFEKAETLEGEEKNALVVSARKNIQRAVELYPEHFESQLNLSVISESLQKYTDMLAAAEKAHQIAPRHEGALLMLLKALYLNRQDQRALEYMAQYEGRYPNLSENIRQRFEELQAAIAARTAGTSPAQEGTLEEQYRANPSDFEAIIRYAQDLFRLKKYDELIQVLNDAIALARTDQAPARLRNEMASLLNNRGLAKSVSGSPRAALPDFNEAIGLVDDFLLAFENRARAHAALGMAEEAEMDILRVTELNPQRGIALREQISKSKR